MSSNITKNCDLKTACLQIGKHLGLEVIGTAGSVNGAALVESQGVKCYRHDDTENIQKMKEAEGGFDLIVEMLANKNLENDLTMLNTGSGRVMVVKRFFRANRGYFRSSDAEEKSPSTLVY